MEHLRESLIQLFTERFGLLASSATALASAILLYRMTQSGKHALENAIPLENQSIETKPAERISHLAPGGQLLDYLEDGLKTAHDALRTGITKSGNGRCLGTRKGNEYVWKSYQEVYDLAHQFGSALVAKDLQPGEETLVGIYSNNREEWIIASEGLSMFSMVSVPLYDTLGVDACNFIINQTEMRVVVCDTDEKVGKLLGIVADTPSLHTIVVMEELSNNNSQQAEKCNVEVISFSEMLKSGAANLKEPVPPTPDTLVTICYTSGTTGNPKGVMLTHKNMMSNTAAVVAQLPVSLTKEDIHISYLPLAHMFERVVSTFILQGGAAIGFFGGDVRKLTEDMAILKPTVFITVPRLLNRIYDKVMLGVQSSRIKTFLFNTALNKKTAMLKRGEITNNSIWDKLVFRKVQNLMGGRIRSVVIGSAPLSGKVLNFTRCAFGCHVMEGYGQTEATAGISLTAAQEWDVGMVGPPLACNVVKLADVPDMDYYAKDNKGEVCAKGHNIMRGYYKDPEKTKDAFDDDGWLRTGDIGQWMPNGTLKIIDRRKHIFKLSQGEYVAPEKIEGIYTRSPFVAQAFVDGRSLESFVVAIIVPDPDYMPLWAKKEGIKGSMEEMCANSVVKKAILDDILKRGRDAGLKGFEQVKAIHLHPEMFSVENELLTPTFKSKRPALRQHFTQQMDAMYIHEEPSDTSASKD